MQPPECWGLIPVVCPRGHSVWPREAVCLPPAVCLRAVCSLQILVYHPAFIKYVFDSWLQGHGRYPSTGILSVIFSLHVCDEVCPSPGPAGPAGHQGPLVAVPERPWERLCYR